MLLRNERGGKNDLYFKQPNRNAHCRKYLKNIDITLLTDERNELDANNTCHHNAVDAPKECAEKCDLTLHL